MAQANKPAPDLMSTVQSDFIDDEALTEAIGRAKTIAPKTVATPEQESGTVIVLFDTTVMEGLNTLRLSVQVPFQVKTQDGEITSFSEVSLVPGLQEISAEKWCQFQSSKNAVLQEALSCGAIREYLNSANEFNSFHPYEAFEAVKKCIDEASLKLLQHWMNGSLATQNKRVGDAIAKQLTDLTGNDSFTQARNMMPSASI